MTDPISAEEATELRETAQWHIDHDARPPGFDHYPEAVLDLLDERVALSAEVERLEARVASLLDRLSVEARGAWIAALRVGDKT